MYVCVRVCVGVYVLKSANLAAYISNDKGNISVSAKWQ